MQKSGIVEKRSISKIEFSVLDSIHRSGMVIFGARDLERLTGIKRGRCYQIISRMKRKGLISEIEAGKYSIVHGELDILSIASHVVFPSYISFWSALSWHGFTEQLPRTTFVVTTKRREEIEYEETRIKFVTLSPPRFFGYIRSEDVVIADREKSLIDSLLLPRYAGGIKEVAKCLSNAWEEISEKTITDYTLRMGNASLIKRLGYLTKALKLPIDKDLLKLKSNIGKGYSLLDPSSPKSKKYDHEWMLNLNVDIKKEAIL